METNSSVRWTDDDDARWLGLKAEGKPSHEIASILMRNRSSVEQRFYIFNRRVVGG